MYRLLTIEHNHRTWDCVAQQIINQRSVIIVHATAVENLIHRNVTAQSYPHLRRQMLEESSSFDQDIHITESTFERLDR